MEQYLEQSDSVFAGLDTKYQQKRHLTSIIGLVLPKNYKVGTRENREIDGSTKQVPVFGQYVSIIDTLTQLEASPPTLDSSHDHDILHRFEDIVTFRESEYCIRHPNAMRLTLYHHDIECDNGLGSRASINKPTMFYMTVNDCMTNSSTKGKLSAINLGLVCYSSDITEYGYKKILQPLIDDLRKLYDGVVLVGADGRKCTLHAKLEHLVGDNLAANQILNMVTSFRTHYCRFGYISGADPSSAVTCTKPLRTAATHQRDVEAAEADPNSFKTMV